MQVDVIICNPSNADTLITAWMTDNSISALNEFTMELTQLSTGAVMVVLVKVAAA